MSKLGTIEIQVHDQLSAFKDAVILTLRRGENPLGQLKTYCRDEVADIRQKLKSVSRKVSTHFENTISNEKIQNTADITTLTGFVLVLLAIIPDSIFESLRKIGETAGPLYSTLQAITVSMVAIGAPMVIGGILLILKGDSIRHKRECQKESQAICERTATKA